MISKGYERPRLAAGPTTLPPTEEPKAESKTWALNTVYGQIDCQSPHEA